MSVHFIMLHFKGISMSYALLCAYIIFHSRKKMFKRQSYFVIYWPSFTPFEMMG